MKPVINKITPFDASLGGIISMAYNGELPYRNRVIIYDAVTFESVYDRTVTNYSMEHAVPAGALQNGKKYAAQGQVFNSLGVASELSDKGYFWALTTPTFCFSNISNEDMLNKASFFASLSYSQAEGEKISEYRFYLYDDVKKLLLESEAFYNGKNFNYAFKGLEDDKFYYIRARGATANGISLDTGFVKVFVNYENPKDYKLIDARCNGGNSVVTYQTNFVAINPSQSSDAAGAYEFDSGHINLIGKTLVYDSEFIVSGDFTMTIKMKSYDADSALLKCSNENCGFTITTPMDDKGDVRFKLSVPNGICNYILYSNPIAYDISDIVTLHIRRINGIYQLYCFVGEGRGLYNNMWFGVQEPAGAEMAIYDAWINVDDEECVIINKDNVNTLLMKDEPVLLADEKYDIWIGG